ncbi:hydrophobic surface binding protein A-domain-containing protein [Crepidotus variabilis]|uniref:Hydrophobic surface binding protein A-domain-containing protein n=1 Tax=Crepidotus variabilis TaxID=179855 RepID=A0A9P6E8A0_9AGAR|nr:hydrophobic surface binding protein A-domain-containing protein [Crepidotus variabilis]
MVKIASTLLVLLPFVGTALTRSISLLPRDLAQVNADLKELSTKIDTLDSALTAYPTSGNLIQALAIHNDALAVASSLSKTTQDVTTTGPVSDNDSTNILNTVQGKVPTIKRALTTIVAKKSGFTSLPVSGVPALIKQDLGWLSGNTTALANALITNAPPFLVANATALKKDVEAAFATAIAAYSQ